MIRAVLLILIGMLGGQTTALAQQQASGTIKGSVVLPASGTIERSSGRYGNPYQRSQASKKESEPSGAPVLIWIEYPAGRPHPLRKDPVVLNQKNQRFVPRLVPVIIGETVRVDNSDPVYHNVFSLSKVKRFEVSRRPKGDYKDIVMDKTGVIDVFCDIHSNMHAIIVVMPRSTDHWITRNGSGSFQFEKVKAGEYTVGITALGYKTQYRSITVGENKTVNLESIHLER